MMGWVIIPRHQIILNISIRSSYLLSVFADYFWIEIVMVEWVSVPVLYFRPTTQMAVFDIRKLPSPVAYSIAASEIACQTSACRSAG